MSSVIIKLIAKTHIDSAGCLGIGSIILKFGMYNSLETNLIWVCTIMVPIENKFNYVTNITSSFSSNIPKWKS